MITLNPDYPGNTRVRESPSLDSPVIDRLIHGVKYKGEKFNDEWYAVKGEKGKSGYSMSKYITEYTEPDITPSDIILTYTREQVEEIIKYLEGVLNGKST